MIIEIQEPELEALILERMQRCALPRVEDALLQALKSSQPLSGLDSAVPDGPLGRTGADLVAAMQN